MIHKCPICKHGETDPAKVTVVIDRAAVTIVLRDVPAMVCSNCGEQFVDEATTRRLLQLGEDAVNRGVQFEVRACAA